MKIVRTHRTPVILAAVTGLGIGLFRNYPRLTEPPLYEARAIVDVGTAGKEPTGPFGFDSSESEWLYEDWFHERFRDERSRFIRSRETAELAVSILERSGRYSLAGVEDAAGRLLSRVAVRPLPEANLVEVVVVHEDPGSAALWANAVAEAAVRRNLRTRRDQLREAYNWFDERAAYVRRDVLASARELHEFVADGRGVAEGELSGDLQALRTLNERYLEAKMRRLELKSTLDLADRLRREDRALDVVPAIAADPLVRDLSLRAADLRAEIITLKNRYQDHHPRIEILHAQVRRTQELIAAQANKLLTGVEADYERMQRLERELRASLTREKRKLSEINRESLKREMLAERVRLAEKHYEAVLERLKKFEVAGTLTEGNMSIIDRASVATEPIRRPWARSVVSSMLLWLGLGVGLVTLRAHLDDTFKTQAEVERHVGSYCLASIPPFEETSSDVVAESYRSVRTGLIFSRRGERGNVVLVTSFAEKEGRSTTAIRTARALAESGEATLLIDSDLRRGRLHGELGLDGEPGILEYCARETDLEGVIQPTRFENLDVLASGKRAPNPPALIGSPAFLSLLDECRDRYSWILLDSPAILSGADAPILGRAADIVLLVAGYGRLDRRTCRRGLLSLRRAGLGLDGVVFNGAALEGEEVSYRGYYELSEGALSSKMGVES